MGLPDAPSGSRAWQRQDEGANKTSFLPGLLSGLVGGYRLCAPVTPPLVGAQPQSDCGAPTSMISDLLPSKHQHHVAGDEFALLLFA